MIFLRETLHVYDNVFRRGQADPSQRPRSTEADCHPEPSNKRSRTRKSATLCRSLRSQYLLALGPRHDQYRNAPRHCHLQEARHAKSIGALVTEAVTTKVRNVSRPSEPPCGKGRLAQTSASGFSSRSPACCCRMSGVSTSNRTAAFASTEAQNIPGGTAHVCSGREGRSSMRE